jgi:hypothetical protein
MHKLTFFNLGNADSCRIDLANGKKVLIDFGNQADPDDQYDLRCDLAKELREDLDDAGHDYFDVVAISHLDKDHYQGASDFFWLDHAKRYQDDDRININTLWVPAAVITETGVSDAEGKVIQAEARHRLKEGEGIRVFSRPEKLKKWLEQQGIEPQDREHLITDAGQIVPEFNLSRDEIEFFVHSPFAKRLDDGTVEDRNDDSLVLQATFSCEGIQTKTLHAADVTHDIIADMVNITKSKGNENRLVWDVFKLPHHCSYLSLGSERGEDETEPAEEVAWLYEEKGSDSGIIVSTSKLIPSKGSDEDKDDDPPHRQAAKYYEDVADDRDGEFIVTMEHPKKTKPKPLVIEIDSKKATVKKIITAGAAAAIGSSTPRAG